MGVMKFGWIKIFIFVFGFIALLFLGVMLGGAYFLPSVAKDVAHTNATTSEALLGERAPYFDLPNLVGDHVAVSAFVDKPLLVVFWASWNEQSTDALHIIDEYLAAEPRVASLVSVVAINSQEEKSLVSTYMRRGGYRVPVLLDALGKTSEEYEVKSLPVYYFIDHTGVVREIYAGVLSQKMLGDKIEQLLK
jgi:hypothetical protein